MKKGLVSKGRVPEADNPHVVLCHSTPEKTPPATGRRLAQKIHKLLNREVPEAKAGKKKRTA